MPLSTCIRCGKSDPQRMIALMTPWFGRFVDLPPAPSYFHLCPACFAEKVEPFADGAMEKLWEMHPDARPEEE